MRSWRSEFFEDGDGLELVVSFGIVDPVVEEYGELNYGIGYYVLV